MRYAKQDKRGMRENKKKKKEEEEKGENLTLPWLLMPFCALAANWANVRKPPDGEGLLGIEGITHGLRQ